MANPAALKPEDCSNAHIIANWPPVYIGKESDKHSEEEHLSLPEFKAISRRATGKRLPQ